MEVSPKVPCILHMDSIKGSHRGLKNLIQSYLCEEWKERHTEPAEDVSSNFFNFWFVPLELPQQENSFDCGLFLLHYVELFIEQAPVNFSPFRLTEFSNFLSKDWFPPAEASLKRARIKKLIYEIVEDYSKNDPPAACNKKCPSESPDINQGNTGEEFIHEIYNSTETCHGGYSNSNADQEIDITALAATSPRGVQCFGESELVFDEFVEPGNTGGPLPDGNYQPFGQMVVLNQFKNFMSPIEEGEETACSPADNAGGRQVANMIEHLTTPSAAKNLREMETCYFEGISMDPQENEKRDPYSGTSSGGAPVSLELQNDEDCMPEELLVSDSEEERDKYESSSMSSDGLAACIVEDSPEANGTPNVNENENSPRQERIIVLCSQEADSMENTARKADNMPSVAELEQQAAKRQRLIMPPGVGR